MQVQAKNETPKEDISERTLTVLMDGDLFQVAGKWNWPFSVEELFCSDVLIGMDPGAEGKTKVLLYPDDKAGLKSWLQSPRRPAFSFRVISSYGEVRELSIGSKSELARDPGFLDQFKKESWQKIEQQKDSFQKDSLRRQELMTIKLGEKIGSFGTWFMNSVTHQVYFSDGIFHMHGLPPQSLNPHLHTFSPFIHPEDRGIFTTNLEYCYQNRCPLHLEYRIVLNESGTRHVRHILSWAYSATGDPVMSGFLQDITHEHQLEEESSRISARQQEIALQLQQTELMMGLGTWQINLLTRRTEMSEQVKKIYGIKNNAGPVTMNMLRKFVHPDDQGLVEEAYRQILYDHVATDINYRIIRPDGRIRFLRQQGKLSISPSKEMIMMGTIADMTENENAFYQSSQAKARLSIQETLLQHQEENARTGSWFWNLDSGEMEWTNGFFVLFGLRKINLQLDVKLVQKLILPEDRHLFSEAISRITSEGEGSVFQFRFMRYSEVKTVRAHFKLVKEEKPVFYATFIDITSEESFQSALNEQTFLSEGLSDASPDRVFVTDSHNYVIRWNQRCTDDFGIRKESAMGRNIFDLFPALLQPENISLFQRALNGEKIYLRDRKALLSPGFEDQYFIPIKNNGNEVVAVLAVLHDTTREYKLRQELTERLQFIGKLLESSVDRIVVLDRNLNYLYWNSKAADYYGIREQEVIGKNILELFPSFIGDPSFADLRRSLKGEVVHIPAGRNLEEKKGYFETFLIPIKDERDEVTGILWIVHDLIGQYQLEQEQRKANQILESIDEAYVEIEFDGTIRYINRQAENFLQQSKEELIGNDIFTVFPGADGSEVARSLKSCVDNRTAFRGEYYNSGTHRWMFLSCSVTGTGVILLFYDMTGMKISEENHALEHIRLKEAQALGHIGSFEWNVLLDQYYWSDEMYRIHGLVPHSERITRKRIHGFYPPEESERLIGVMNEAASRPGVISIEHPVKLDDGTIKFIRKKMESVAGPDGRVMLVNGTIQDITDQKKKEEENSLKDAQWQSLVSSLPDHISVWDGELNLLHFNKEKKLKGNDYWNAVIEDMEGQAAMLRNEAASTGQPAEGEVSFASGDRQHFVHVTVIPVPDTCGRTRQFIQVARDITSSKIAEKQLKQSHELLESVFNSPNVGINVFSAVRDSEGSIIDFRFVLASRKGREFIGIDELRGRSLLEMLPSFSEFLPRWAKLVEEGGTDTYESQAIVNGKESWFMNANSKFGDGIIQVWQDSTETRLATGELFRVRDLLRMVFDASINGIMVLAAIRDEESRVVDFSILLINPAGERYMVSPEKEGRTILTAFPSIRDSGRFHAYVDVLENGTTLNKEFGYAIEGMQWWFHNIAMRINPDQIVVSFADITEKKRAEEEIIQKTKEIRLQLQLEEQAGGLAATGHWQWDTGTGFVRWNANLFRLLGYEQGAFRPTMEKLLERIHPEDRQEFLRRTSTDSVQEAGPFEFRVLLENDTRYFRAAFRISPGEKGNIVIGTVQDTTEDAQLRIKLKERTAYAESIIDASIDRYCVFDMEGKIIAWNRRWEETTGLRREKARGKSFEEIFPKMAQDIAFIEARKQALDGSYSHLPPKMEGYGPAYFEQFFIPLQDPDGNSSGVLHIMSEVSELVHRSEELHELNRTLEMKNAELAEKNEEITAFAFVASHDLKEPLRKIQTFSDLLLSRESGNITPSGHNYIRKMNAAVRRVELLIEDILVLTGVHSDRGRNEPVDLEAVIRMVISDIQHYIDQSNPVIEVGELPVVKGNENQIFYLFKNLLTNAIKFQQRDNRPRVQISFTITEARNPRFPGNGESKDYFRICVQDNGIGFEKRYFGKIFQMFQRLHGKNEFEGTGMGLAICKKIMDNHEGFIEVQSKPDSGSTFCCYFPL
jgi:PAS domain S-box-containing protein